MQLLALGSQNRLPGRGSHHAVGSHDASVKTEDEDLLGNLDAESERDPGPLAAVKREVQADAAPAEAFGVTYPSQPAAMVHEEPSVDIAAVLGSLPATSQPALARQPDGCDTAASKSPAALGPVRPATVIDLTSDQSDQDNNTNRQAVACAARVQKSSGGSAKHRSGTLKQKEAGDTTGTALATRPKPMPSRKPKIKQPEDSVEFRFYTYKHACDRDTQLQINHENFEARRISLAEFVSQKQAIMQDQSVSRTGKWSQLSSNALYVYMD